MPKHFCCCLSLKTGAIVMSFLNLLEGSVIIIASIIELSDIEQKPQFEKAMKKINLMGKVCNTTKFCNETVIHQRFPTEQPGLEGNITLYLVCLTVGLISVFNGILLLMGMLKAKDKYILLYVLLGFMVLFIITIYTGINMFSNGVLMILFLLSIFMCYGQFAMYHFYEEVAEYNTVKSGVIEIAYNGDAKSYNNSVMPEETNENTAV